MELHTQMKRKSQWNNKNSFTTMEKLLCTFPHVQFKTLYKTVFCLNIKQRNGTLYIIIHSNLIQFQALRNESKISWKDGALFGFELFSEARSKMWLLVLSFCFFLDGLDGFLFVCFVWTYLGTKWLCWHLDIFSLNLKMVLFSLIFNKKNTVLILPWFSSKWFYFKWWCSQELTWWSMESWIIN